VSDFEFVAATKEQAKARIALAGPSGSGKTMTGLILATRLAAGGRTAVIDTERGSASKYAGLFQFDRLNMYRYDPRDLPKALAAAASAGYESVLIDSLSRFWSGAGGMLEFVDGAAKRSYGGNSFGGWKEARPVENELIESMLGYPGHVVVTMRTKTAYEITKNEKGQTVPVKIGLQPEQRNGIEYEFDIVADMDLENTLTVSKSRCPELSGQVLHRPDHVMAETVLGWLTDGVAGTTPNDYRDRAADPGASHADLQELYVQVKSDGKLGAMVMDSEGRMTTLADLITRRGKLLAGRQDGAPAVPAGEHAWVSDFRVRLAETPTLEGIARRKNEVHEARESGISQELADMLLQEIGDRQKEISDAAGQAAVEEYAQEAGTDGQQEGAAADLAEAGATA
jgi:hypothetical protein